MKKLALMAVLLGVAMISSFAASKKDGEKNTLTVMSYNIRYGKAKDGTNSWEYRYPATFAMIEEQQPDLLGVQEALENQLGMIDFYFDGKYKYVGVGRDDGKKKGETMAIFYNTKTIKVLKWGNFWLSPTPNKPGFGWGAKHNRTATWAIVKHKKTGKKFFYVNTHLDHQSFEAQIMGMNLIMEKMQELNPKGYPCILTGDFNILPDNPVIAELDKKMSSARRYAAKTDNSHSFNGWGKSKKVIDYIYYSGFDSDPVLFETITKKYVERPFVSDHFPIKAVFEF